MFSGSGSLLVSGEIGGAVKVWESGGSHRLLLQLEGNGI